MPIKAVILDRDGTLCDPYTRQPAPGVPEMISRLQALGLKIFVVSNESREKTVEENLGLSRDCFLYTEDCGNKGSKNFVEKVLATLNVDRNEVVYLGDSEHDMQEASNSRVILFNAEWSNPGYEYGIAMSSPSEFADEMENYYLKTDLWFATIDSADSGGRSIIYRGLLDPDKCRDTGITNLLKARKPFEDLTEKDKDLGSHLISHLIASLYLEGIHLRRAPRSGGLRKPLCCLYPGSKGGKSLILEVFERYISSQFSMYFFSDLLVRHTDAESSKEARQAKPGTKPPISDQFNTVEVNEKYKSKVKGNVITVVDDFSTGGNALEVSRNLLLAAGAKEVIGITVGKYRGSYMDCVPVDAKALKDPRRVVSEVDFRRISVPFVQNLNAEKAFS